jgi:hypothetical protein
MKNTQQMELGFGIAPRRSLSKGRRTRLSRWWFNRMRELVDNALDWHPAPAPPPEQPLFTLARREINLRDLRPVDSAELQVCE